MHPEIDKLIEMALADGIVSDKEREIILRKAEKLGLDVDEVEMYLEGMIQKVKNSNFDMNSNKIKSNRNFNLKKIKSIKHANLESENDLKKSINDFEFKKCDELEKLKQIKDIVKNCKEDIRFKKLNIENLLTVLKSKFINDALFKFYNEYNNESIKKLHFNPRELVIKNSWLHGFKAINRKMNKKFDNLIFALSNSIFFFDKFLVIQNSDSGLSALEMKKLLESKEKNPKSEYFIYNYDGEIRKIKLDSEGYVAINYDDLLYDKYSIQKTNDKFGNYFTVVKFGENSFRIKENLSFSSISTPLNDIINQVFSPVFEFNTELNNTNDISINSIYSYRKFLTAFINTTQSNEADDLNELINELDLKIKNYNNKNNELIEKTTFIQSLKNKIQKTQKAIDNEYELRKFASQAIGTVSLYNRLNENYSFYDEAQFNKIIRFLDHVESKENNYRDLYVTCTNEYINNSNTIPIQELKKEENQINDCYKLLLVLVTEVNGDKVKFNKVYNSLEDAGLFMTVPEKKNLQYLSDISSKLDMVINGLKNLFESLEGINETLGEIEGNTSEMSNYLWDISWNTSSLNS